jgi:hypothetical protein
MEFREGVSTDITLISEVKNEENSTRIEMKNRSDDPKDTQKLIIREYKIFMSLLNVLLNVFIVLFLKINDEQAKPLTINREAIIETNSTSTIKDISDVTEDNSGTIKKKLNRRVTCSADSREFILKNVL